MMPLGHNWAEEDAGHSAVEILPAGGDPRHVAASALRSYIMGMATRHEQHLELAGEALVEAARRAVEGTGEKWTDLRAHVFEALAALGTPSSAYDVTERVSDTLGRRIAANSVYRILDVLVAANVAQRVESANAYVVNVHPGCRHDCVFLICDVCGRFDHFDDDRMGASLRRAARSTGFGPVRPILEVRGTCSVCVAAAASTIAD